MNKLVAVDIYHGDPIVDLSLAKNFGIQGIIHKAVQGVGYTDPRYAKRRIMAEDAGIPHWGAYAFNTNEDVAAQVRHFLAVAAPDAKTFMALDYEDNTAGQMSLNNMIVYLSRLDQYLGRFSWLYSGNRIKQAITKATDSQRDFLAAHPFWLCEYGNVAKMVDVNRNPLPWVKPDLWQNAADGFGPQPHRVPGIDINGVDCNVFDGTPEELAAIWPGKGMGGTNGTANSPTS